MVAAEDVDEPYARLLVHKNDMTPTLEKYHNSKLHLDVLRQFSCGSTYSREVRLICDSTGEIVEYGAIMIFLDMFPENARRLIIDGEKPLGAILRDERIFHVSNPIAYFKVESDSVIQRVFNLNTRTHLFGRCNRISGVDDQPLAKIVEVLPKE